MGEVYLAEHPRLPRRDALKVLPADVSADCEYRARFNREADLASKLWHPHIVSVHDRGEYEGQLWISMDYVDGPDAARLLVDRYPAGMPVDRVMRIVTAVGSALDYAHKQGLLHRDVKPANIMLTHVDDDEDERILLTDFGIAHTVDEISGLTSTNMTVGTAAYAAPEQLMGDEVDGRADQYALAAAAYQLMTGRQLFPQSNPAAVISRHLNAVPPRLSDVNARLAALDPPLQRALSKNRNNRFTQCQGFAKALADVEERSGANFWARDSALTRAARNQEAERDTVEPTTGKSRQRGIITAFALTLTGLGLALVCGLVLDRFWRHPSRQPSPPFATSALTPSPTIATANTTTVASLTPTPTTTATTETTTTKTTTSTVHALPVAVVGSGCRPKSTPTVDSDGATVYCARIQYTDGFVWSRIADTVPYPVPLGMAGSGPPIDQQICAKQTGRSIAYCATAISEATYEGDGPTGCPPGVEACGG